MTAEGPLVSLIWIDKTRVLVDALAQFDSGPAGIELVCVSDLDDLPHSIQPDICLMCAAATQEYCREIVELLPVKSGDTRLAVFADDLSDTQIDQAVGLSATGFMSRRDSLVQVFEQVIRLSRDETVVSERLVHRIRWDASAKRLRIGAENRLGSLSSRQMKILQALAGGESVHHIAREFDLSEQAIQAQQSLIMDRLGIHDRVDLSRWAIRIGLISKATLRHEATG